MIFSRLFMSEFTELPFVVGLHLTVICQIGAASFQSIEPFFSGQYIYILGLFFRNATVLRWFF
jgi:hypothetical protein